jgi:hypothetical protein
MSTEVILFIVANFISLLTYAVYAFTRFARLENEVKHLVKQNEDFAELKNTIYKIYAQNEILLSFKTSSSFSPQKSV